jgi:hypothetical protein
VKLRLASGRRNQHRSLLPLHRFPRHIQEAATRAFDAKRNGQDGEDGFWIDFKANWSLVLRITGMLQAQPGPWPSGHCVHIAASLPLLGLMESSLSCCRLGPQSQRASSAR